jgi:hypothetical protein
MVWTALATPAPEGGMSRWRCRTFMKGAPQMGKAKVDLNSVTTVGLDLAKHVFQIHAVDVDGKIRDRQVVEAQRRAVLL